MLMFVSSSTSDEVSCSTLFKFSIYIPSAFTYLEANHDRFSSRFFNMLQYAEMGGKDIIKKTWKDLKDYIKLECDGKEYTDLVKSRGYHCIIFLNIPK